MAQVPTAIHGEPDEFPNVGARFIEPVGAMHGAPTYVH